jgi:hypothetical protein
LLKAEDSCDVAACRKAVDIAAAKTSATIANNMKIFFFISLDLFRK